MPPRGGGGGRGARGGLCRGLFPSGFVNHFLKLTDATTVTLSKSKGKLKNYFGGQIGQYPKLLNISYPINQK